LIDDPVRSREDADSEAGDLLGRKPGEWLWDDDYGYAAFLRHEKATQIPRNWSALCQQRPAPETGDYFKAEWFRTYVSEPPRETLNVYGGSDYAVTSRGGDYTVHIVVGVDPEKPHVPARSLARPALLRHLDRGVVRPGAEMAAGALGRGAGADHFRGGAVS
jgi:hypothetical protein